MAKTTDGREARGRVRRLVWSDAARAVRAAAPLDYERRREADLARLAGADGDGLESLYRETRRRLVAWLEQRAAGELRTPPGGVGGAWRRGGGR